MTTLFPKVSRTKRGYDVDEVDDFFEHAREVYEGVATEPLTIAQVQTAVFELVRGGYRTADVDGALDRLEAAFVAAQRQEVVAAQGAESWNTRLVDRAQTLYERLGRPEGERFAPGTRGKPAYDRDDVDDLCDRLVDFFDSSEPLTAREVRAATFRRRRGRRGYDEASVDAFLRRATEVLVAVE